MAENDNAPDTFITGKDKPNEDQQEDLEAKKKQEEYDYEKWKQEEEERARQEEEERVRKRQEQALMFEKYLEDSGLSLSFQIIFTEII
mmetsp:Transcript_31561/g.30874  ORF Transcript_31561/g.30874 Transcript_31561/m.30874 type:complete len:88 (-) Transcript_31561:143-406(-)